ncbi:NAD(P)H-hydrate dehydratase [Clostridium sp. BJN0001]|uniref:NAD(P)H-hydrate dehydratase n=1 Tax=Clostridium sp. BJN0001 TaxID=2930219 RepID=UPI001FD15D63|nr:NAD(P)H-hydrate dehydratase [Clostridium sp. BJN0001]
MIDVLSSKNCRMQDKETIERVGIPSVVLMENAALKIFYDIKDKGNKFLIFCGTGNNGGDGLAIARHLIETKKEVIVYIVGNIKKLSNENKIYLNILNNIMEIKNIRNIADTLENYDDVIKEVEQNDIIIDAMFGTGLSRNLSQMYVKLIDIINDYGKYKVSIDIPSGLDCDTGKIYKAAVHADTTYTIENMKLAFLIYNAIEYIGNIKIIKIGIPDKVKRKFSENIYIMERDEYKYLIPCRKIYGHKGNYGNAVIVSGKDSFTGAAFICTECTVRAGAGLTTLITHPNIKNLMSSKLIEAMTMGLEDENVIKKIKAADSIAFGPGFGFSILEENFLKKVIENSNCNLVIDADGITILSRNKELFTKLKNRTVITPHPGEMARLADTTIESVESDRIGIAKSIAKKYGIVVLLKGYNTVITDGNDTYINKTGNSKMASGGMGDALTGIINALLSQKMSPVNAAVLGAYIHGNIADTIAQSSYIVNARDIISNLPKEIENLLK